LRIADFKTGLVSLRLTIVWVAQYLLDIEDIKTTGVLSAILTPFM
jgi:hypothetical protein